MDEFDPTQMSDQEVLSLPESNVPAAKLDIFMARRTAIIEQNETEKTALRIELAHDSGQRSDRATEEQEQLKLHQYLAAMDDLRARENELIDRIEVQHRETLRRLQDIDDRAIKLHDGRRAYVDGAEFRDKDGAFLRGADKQEAERLKTKTSSEWAQESKWQRRNDLEVDDLHNLRENHEKLDEAARNAANMTESEHAESLRQGKALAARLEKQTATTSEAFDNDYASASATTDSRRATSYAASLDGRRDGPAIAPDFSAAAAGRSTPPEQKRPELEGTSPAPSPSGP